MEAKPGRRSTGGPLRRRLDGPTLALSAIALMLIGSVLALDVLTPPDVAAGALYSLVIFYSWLFPSSALVVGIGVGCTLLTFAELVLGGASVSDIVGINKLIAIVTIWVSTALVLFVKSSSRHVEDARLRLEAESVKLETALEHAPNAMLMVDAKGIIQLVNRQAEILFGYPRRQLLGESVDLLVPDRVRAEHGELRAKFLTQQPEPRLMGAARHLAVRRKDGVEVPVEIALNPIETPDGVRVMVSVIDIRERRAAEDRLRLAIEAAPNAMMMVDAAGKIVLTNKQAEVLFGYRRDELTDVDMLVPDAIRKAHPGLLSKFFSDPKARAAGTGRDLMARRKDGTEVPVEIGLNPIETPSGTLVMASIVDITERKLAAALVEEQHRLKAERLTRELQLAERIQTSLLPRPPLVPGIEIAARMVPAAEVGGDYYDVLPADDGCWLAIGDVSGHGLNAGVVSLMVQSATSAILRSMPDISPAGAVAGINATLHDNVRQRLTRDDFVTFSLLRYRRDGTVVHCGAHEDILVWRAATRTVELHPTEGSWLALHAELELEPRELRLGDGDVMVLMTDGLIENRNRAGEMLGLEAATKLLAERADLAAGDLVDALVQQTLRWATQPEDDITVVALRHRARPAS